MTPAIRRRLALAGLGLVIAALVAVLTLGGEDPYQIQLALNNTHGLREGSGVRVGGIEAGEVESIHLGDGDKVIVDAKIDRKEAPVGKDVRVSIGALNLLGQKFLEVEKGDVGDPAPSGYRVPPSRVMVSTDLDQVLNVLDADTRTRLGILMNEAGLAVGGRREDVNLLLREFPHTLHALTTLIERVATDNQTLGQLIDHSDRFIARINRERGELVKMLDTLGQAAEQIGSRRADLQQTLARAPRMLRTTRAFLADLRNTAGTLGPAAQNLAATAPPLDRTLARLGPFTRAADPALAQASDVAPLLSQLGTSATPVVRRAAKTAQSLETFSASTRPATRTLHRSAGNIFAILDNWSNAIQFRDSLSHYFRGELTMTSNSLEQLVDRLQAQQRARGNGRRAHGRRSRSPVPGPTSAPAPIPASPERGVPSLEPLRALDNPVKGITGVPEPKGSTGDRPAEPRDELLDFLLGA